jgi:hypothetical protein
MENINNLRQLLVRLSEEVKRLNSGYIELNCYFAEEAECINRLDMMTAIDSLKARLLEKVNKIRNEERSSEDAFGIGNMFSGMLHLATGSITSAVLKQKNPLSSGLKLATRELGKKADFGTVMMALKKNGKLEDIETIAVSRLARETKTTEFDIMSSYTSIGYSLKTPEELWEYLDRLKANIKEDSSLK